MSIQIFNTATGKKEVLKPLTAGHVKMYVCGITAYDYCHIGHARSVLAFDMIVRYLRYRGYEVTFVRNFTDIDDKIINRAREAGTTSEELASRFIRAYYEDVERLGVLPPTLEPKATGHIPQIIEMIRELIDKGLAYQANGDVYYAVDKFASYGALSGRSLDDMQAGARIAVNEQKHHAMDFALWKASKPGEPTWDSPWGPGRPGWHIECSAMSRHYLGDSFDIHGGGKDLIFPHHENEIAQSEGVTGRPFANLWVHHGFVTIKDEKMSKSLGNFLTIRDVLANYHPEVLRLFIFSTHYRNPLDFSETAMQDAEAGLDRLYDCLADIAELAESEGGEGGKNAASAKDGRKIATLVERFNEAMDNDFNTAQGLASLFDAVKTLNKITHALPSSPGRVDLELLRKGAATLTELGHIMGLLNEEPRQYRRTKQQQLLAKLDIDAPRIEALIRERTEAREQKNWSRSDEIRDQLLALNIELKDSPEGTTWRVVSSR